MALQNLLDWLVVGLRWTHIVAMLGWVGSALYFNWLESKLRSPEPARPTVLGEAWMGHGGGFYIVEKRQIAPGHVPSPVYWFRVEAGITWITGFLLLVFVYYWTGGADLVAPEGAVLSPASAIAFAIGVIVAAWIVYDRIWVSQFALDNAALMSAVSLALLLAVVFVLCKLFTGRAAFIHVGAIIGTNMVFSVWTRIIPSQEEAVAATSAGRERNMGMAQRARRRALHNTYLTLPVIFTMIAVHAPAAYGHPLNWLILSLLIAVGISARHMMLMFDRARPFGREWLLPGAPLVASLLVIGFLSVPRNDAAAPADARVPFTVVKGILDLRCAACHSTRPTDKAFTAAPGGIVLATPGQIAVHAAAVKATTAARTMPPGNSTRMTEEERSLLSRWVDQGASTATGP
jgi:uncharacterized membrane protein